LVIIVGLTRPNFVKAMVYQSATKFLPGSMWLLGSLQFITDKFRDLTLQECRIPKFLFLNVNRFPKIIQTFLKDFIYFYLK
jgi:hypothetical protein